MENALQRASQDAVQAGVLAAAHLLRHRAFEFESRSRKLKDVAPLLSTELMVRASALRSAAAELETDANAALGDSPEAMELRRRIRERAERNLGGG